MAARAVIYARTNPSTGADTSDEQEAACRRLAVERGWEAVEVYRDRASGSAFSRPALGRALDRIRAGHYDALVASEAATISRSVTHLDAVTSDADASGVVIVAADGCMDTSTAADGFAARVTTAFTASEYAAMTLEEAVGDASAE